MNQTPYYPTTIPLLLLAAACLLCGCGGNTGLETYELSGQATFDGQPLPYGSILLEPDTDLGNSGPGSVAEISDGSYNTRAGKGHVGGPHVATIIATDGTQPENPDVDNSLFPPYRTKIDLPKEDSKHDFDVPKPE